MFPKLPKDICTKIISNLKYRDLISLLCVFPALQINWQTIHNMKNDPVTTGLEEIHKKYFPITKESQLKALRSIYYFGNLDQRDDDEFYDEFCEYIWNIPIIETNEYKVQDYICR